MEDLALVHGEIAQSDHAMYMWRDKQHRRAHTWHACLWLLCHTLPSSVSKSWQLSSTTCSLCYVATRSVLLVLVCYYNASGRKSECLHSYTHTVSSIGIHLLAFSLEPVVATAIYFYGYIVRWLYLALSMQLDLLNPALTHCCFPTTPRQCSRTCQGGKQTRNVKCIVPRTGVPMRDSACPGKPATHRPCNEGVICGK